MENTIQLQQPSKLSDLASDLKSVFIQRDLEVDLMVLALLAEEHCLFLGDPGTGKTALANAFSEGIGLSTWTYLLTKVTKDFEVFGPTSIKGLEKDVVTRITKNKLPEAEFAILDEVFKCNSSILNSLLTILNERQFDNPDRQSVPLKMAVGLSNEMPDGGTSGPLNALYDRFVVRHWVKGIQGRADIMRLIEMDSAPKVNTRVDRSDIESLRLAAKAVVLSDNVKNALVEIKFKLEEEEIRISDRRLRKAIKCIKAWAAYNDRNEAVLQDMWCLKHILWTELDQFPTVDAVVTKSIDPDFAAARSSLGTAMSMMKELEALRSQDSKWCNIGAKVILTMKDLQSIKKEMMEYRQSDGVSRCIGKVDKFLKELQDIVNKETSF